MTTIDRRDRTEVYIEYWLPAGSSAKDLDAVIREARRSWFACHEGLRVHTDDWPEFDDWYTIHPHDEHVIVRIKCPDEAS